MWCNIQFTYNHTLHLNSINSQLKPLSVPNVLNYALIISYYLCWLFLLYTSICIT